MSLESNLFDGCPADAVQAFEVILSALPLNASMVQLVVTDQPRQELVEIVQKAVRDTALAGSPAATSGIWLYIDDLDRSHTVSQDLPSTTGSYLHGIMHRREGDFPNSKYWFSKVGRHAATDAIDTSDLAGISGYDPVAFIDAVEAAQGRGEQPAELVALQRREWVALMRFIAQRDFV